MTNQNRGPQNSKRKVPMIITEEAVRDFNIPKEDVTWKRIGNRKCRVVMVDANDEIYRAYTNPVWAEIKREDRESRCLVPGSDGRLIRCPDNRKCESCRYYSEVCREMNRPASLSVLEESGVEQAARSTVDDESIYETLLEDLISMLSEIKPKYGRIFRLLYDGATRQEMADELGIKQRTISDDIQKIRKILQPLMKDTFDR